MKKLLLSFALLLPAVAVSAQTNEDVVKIVEQAVRYESAEEIHGFFLNLQFIRLEDEVAQALGVESGDIVYMDRTNRLYRLAPATKETKIHVIYIKLVFSNLSQASVLFTTNGYRVDVGDGEEDADGHIEREFDATKDVGKDFIWASGRWYANYDGKSGINYTIYFNFMGPPIIK